MNPFVSMPQWRARQGAVGLLGADGCCWTKRHRHYVGRYVRQGIKPYTITGKEIFGEGNTWEEALAVATQRKK